MYYEIINTKEQLFITTYLKSDITYSFYYSSDNSLDGKRCNFFDLYEKRLLSTNSFFSEEDCNILSEHIDNILIIHSRHIVDYKKENMKIFSDFCYRASINGGFKVVC
jgi:hypothetical protein